MTNIIFNKEKFETFVTEKIELSNNKQTECEKKFYSRSINNVANNLVFFLEKQKANVLSVELLTNFAMQINTKIFNTNKLEIESRDCSEEVKKAFHNDNECTYKINNLKAIDAAIELSNIDIITKINNKFYKHLKADEIANNRVEEKALISFITYCWSEECRTIDISFLEFIKNSTELRVYIEDIFNIEDDNTEYTAPIFSFINPDVNVEKKLSTNSKNPKYNLFSILNPTADYDEYKEEQYLNHVLFRTFVFREISNYKNFIIVDNVVLDNLYRNTLGYFIDKELLDGEILSIISDNCIIEIINFEILSSSQLSNDKNEELKESVISKNWILKKIQSITSITNTFVFFIKEMIINIFNKNIKNKKINDVILNITDQTVKKSTNIKSTFKFKIKIIHGGEDEKSNSVVYSGLFFVYLDKDSNTYAMSNIMFYSYEE